MKNQMKRILGAIAIVAVLSVSSHAAADCYAGDVADEATIQSSQAFQVTVTTDGVPADDFYIVAHVALIATSYQSLELWKLPHDGGGWTCVKQLATNCTGKVFTWGVAADTTAVNMMYRNSDYGTTFMQFNLLDGATTSEPTQIIDGYPTLAQDGVVVTGDEVSGLNSDYRVWAIEVSDATPAVATATEIPFPSYDIGCASNEGPRVAAQDGVVAVSCRDAIAVIDHGVPLGDPISLPITDQESGYDAFGGTPISMTWTGPTSFAFVRGGYEPGTAGATGKTLLGTASWTSGDFASATVGSVYLASPTIAEDITLFPRTNLGSLYLDLLAAPAGGLVNVVAAPAIITDGVIADGDFTSQDTGFESEGGVFLGRTLDLQIMYGCNTLDSTGDTCDAWHNYFFRPTFDGSTYSLDDVLDEVTILSSFTDGAGTSYSLVQYGSGDETERLFVVPTTWL